MEKLVKLVEDTCHELKGRYEEAQAELEKQGKLTTETKEAIAAAIKRLDDMEVKMQRPGGDGQPRANKSIGTQFTDSEAYKAMLKRGIWESDTVEVKEIVSSDAGTPGSAGDLVVPYRYAGIIAAPDRELRIRDLLTVIGTTSNSIEYVRETLYTNAAAPVKEVTEALYDSVAKAESSIRFDKTSVPVETLAHWIPATRQIVADAPALQGYINSRLTYGLKQEEEDQLLFGTGTPPNLDGICTQASAFDNSGVLPTDTRIDILRRAILQARLAEYPVTGIVLHPTDWAEIEMLKDNAGRYLWVTVTEGGVSRLWRVPVVETTAMNEGEFLVGAFRMGASIFDREQVTIRLSEHHEDFFVKNLVAILCEERLALVVFRPQAFIYGEFEAGS